MVSFYSFMYIQFIFLFYFHFILDKMLNFLLSSKKVFVQKNKQQKTIMAEVSFHLE